MAKFLSVALVLALVICEMTVSAWFINDLFRDLGRRSSRRRGTSRFRNPNQCPDIPLNEVRFVEALQQSFRREVSNNVNDLALNQWLRKVWSVIKGADSQTDPLLRAYSGACCRCYNPRLQGNPFGNNGFGNGGTFGNNGFGSGGFGTNGFGNGLGTNGFGTNGFGTNGFGTNGFGSTGFGSTGLGGSGFGTGTTGFGTNGFGTNTFGNNGFGTGLGGTTLGGTGLGTGLGGTGLGTGLGGTGLGTGLGGTGLGTGLGGTGLGTGLGGLGTNTLGTPGLTSGIGTNSLIPLPQREDATTEEPTTAAP